MEAEIYTDPVSGATVFDDGTRPMPPQADEPIVVDEDGRGSAFPLPEDAAAFVPQPAAPVAAPIPASASAAPAPAAPTQPQGDVQEILRNSEAAMHTAARASEEARTLYGEALGRAQRVADRRAQAEREWTEGGVTPESVTKFVIDQDQDSRAAAHHMSQAQAKMNDARAYATTAEAGSMWAAIKSRFPRIDEGSPTLRKLAGDLRALREASGFRRPYSELLEEHVEGIRSHLGASAPPPAAGPPAPAASAESNQISLEDARTYGLA